MTHSAPVTCPRPQRPRLVVALALAALLFLASLGSSPPARADGEPESCTGGQTGQTGGQVGIIPSCPRPGRPTP